MKKAASVSPSEPSTAVLSHIGAAARRTLLEDRAGAGKVETASGVSLTVGVIADGIGGENAGERAAEVTVQSIFEPLSRDKGADVPRILEGALSEANQRVFVDASRSRRKANMGSTAAR